MDGDRSPKKSAPPGADLDDLLQGVKAEVDERLAKDGTCDAAVWVARHPSAAEEIEALVAMRVLDHESRASESNGSVTREVAIAEITSRLLDAANHEEKPDLDYLRRLHPDLRDEIEELAREMNLLEEALAGDELPGPVYTGDESGEASLGHYRLR